ncbi:hypothetical protein BDV25DRAFT_113222 [Aspergillus avenaceus]|uniref:Uncharacterized protein n=1 Tax=Aspergillus avenaceus TaxID=36643 RepID=A0A5N6TVB3_ASPAV|nr:hypothetical protein BDV25DRAFT_113222 [Aspergillus avenaceus]
MMSLRLHWPVWWRSSLHQSHLQRLFFCVQQCLTSGTLQPPITLNIFIYAANCHVTISNHSPMPQLNVGIS